jgi:hypothetical protein
LTGNFSDVDIELLFGLGSLVFRAWVLVLMTGENTRRRLLVLVLVFPGGVAAVLLSSCPPVLLSSCPPVGAYLCFFLLYAVYTLPCLVFLPIIWKNSSRAAAGVRFLLKKRTRKKKHENV